MSDLIDRQAAIDAVRSYMADNGEQHMTLLVYKEV